MPKFMCADCGAVYEQWEIPTYMECVGECWGRPYYEPVERCDCGGEIVEAETCERCGEILDDDYTGEGICMDCLLDELPREEIEAMHKQYELSLRRRRKSFEQGWGVAVTHG